MSPRIVGSRPTSRALSPALEALGLLLVATDIAGDPWPGTERARALGAPVGWDFLVVRTHTGDDPVRRPTLLRPIDDCGEHVEIVGRRPHRAMVHAWHGKETREIAGVAAAVRVELLDPVRARVEGEHAVALPVIEDDLVARRLELFEFGVVRVRRRHEVPGRLLKVDRLAVDRKRSFGVDFRRVAVEIEMG